MNNAHTLACCLLAVAVLLVGCSTPPQPRQRFFFPIGNPEPKLEYIKYIASDREVRVERGRAVERLLLGQSAPQMLFDSPYDVIWVGDRLLVSDEGNRRVMVLDLVKEDFEPLRDPQGNLLRIKKPMGLANAGEGFLVADPEDKKIWWFSDDLQLYRILDLAGVISPVAVCYSQKNGRLYVVDTRGHSVHILDDEGTILSTFGSFGGGDGMFRYPVDIEIGPDDNLYVLDSLNARVSVFSLEGVFIRTIGGRGTTQSSLQIPKGIAVDRWGHVYVAESQTHKVVIFSAEGEFLLSVGEYGAVVDRVFPGSFNLPKGIAVNEKGSIAIVDTFNAMVHLMQYLDDEYVQSHPYTEDDIFDPFTQ